MKEYQSRVEEGAERVMSHWVEQEAGGVLGGVLVTWLMADLPLQWRGLVGHISLPPLTHLIDRRAFLLTISTLTNMNINKLP